MLDNWRGTSDIILEVDTTEHLWGHVDNLFYLVSALISRWHDLICHAPELIISCERVNMSCARVNFVVRTS